MEWIEGEGMSWPEGGFASVPQLLMLDLLQSAPFVRHGADIPAQANFIWEELLAASVPFTRPSPTPSHHHPILDYIS